MLCLLWTAFLAVSAMSTPPYTVDHSALRGRSVIQDRHGREVVFRGVNVGVEIWGNDMRPWHPAAYAHGKCPPAAGSTNQPPVCEVEAGHGKWNQSTAFDSQNDLAQMRALGFNLIRLAMSWSLLEPQPLQYSKAYLDRIEQVVEWAAEQDIQVILDMHQDAYSASIEGDDGAPAWACLNVPVPAWVDISWPAISKALPYSKKVLSAFDGLYMNKKVVSTGKGLQEHFLLAWAQVVRRFDAVANVIGYEILNEPAPGILTVLDSVEDVPLLGFSTKYLFPMYRRFIQAMMGVRDGMPDCSDKQSILDDCAFPDLDIKSNKLVFFEPMALRNQLDFSLQVSKPFTEYSNIVFAPHVYTHSFTAKDWPPTYGLALDSAWFEASLLKASVLATEYGGSASTPEIVGNISDQFDFHAGTSGTLWSWKETGDWGMFENTRNPAEPVQNGPLRQAKVKMHSRIYARAVAGGILEHIYNQFTGSFCLRAFAASHTTAPTEVYIPPHLHEGLPSVNGSAVLRNVKLQPDFSRVVEVMPLITGGFYEVTLGPPACGTGPVSPPYRGIPMGAMADLGRAMWPLSNGTYPDTNTGSALPQALAKVAKEVYAAGEQQTAVFV